MNASRARPRQPLDRLRRRCRDFRIGVVFQDEQQGELIEGAWRKRALRRQQPHVARDLATTEEID